MYTTSCKSQHVTPPGMDPHRNHLSFPYSVWELKPPCSFLDCSSITVGLAVTSPQK